MEPAPSRHPLRWIIPIAYVLVMNGFVVLAVASMLFDTDIWGAFDPILNFLSLSALILMIANTVECIVIHARGAEGRRAFSRRVMLLLKLGLIPFFCLGACIIVVFTLLLIHPVLAAAGIITVPFALIIGWFVMMSGSLWAIAYVLGLRRDNLLYTSECVAHFILQLVFFLDVADTIGLFVRGRKLEAQAAATRAPGYPGQAPVSWR